ncbi:MAG: ribbon-helix-helix domain-containing protein [Saccharospirillum sp.]
MADNMNLNVRISGALKDFVTQELSHGAYENISEYIRDLIRRDKERTEQIHFEKLKAELKLAFNAPDTDYIPLSASDIIGKPTE